MMRVALVTVGAGVFWCLCGSAGCLLYGLLNGCTLHLHAGEQHFYSGDKADAMTRIGRILERANDVDDGFQDEHVSACRGGDSHDDGE